MSTLICCFPIPNNCVAVAMVPELLKKAIGAPFRLLGLKLVRRKSPQAGDQRIFFLHLPKCGGVSLNRALSRAFGPHNLAALAPSAYRRAAGILGKNHEEYRTSLLFYYMSMGDVNVVTGHFSWSDKAYDKFSENWVYVTLLRDPVERWFSHYFYDRFGSGDYRDIEDELPQFLGSTRAHEMGTVYTRRLSDSSSISSDQRVDQAKSNLRKFDVLGTLENVGSFERRLSTEVGVDVSMPKKNESPEKNKKKEIKSKDNLRSRVEKLCRSDIQVYNYAKKLTNE